LIGRVGIPTQERWNEKSYNNEKLQLHFICMIRLSVIILAAALASCGGIPIRSMPRLLGLQEEIVTLKPSDFMLAIQVDQRLAPPKDASPTLELTIRPTEPSAFTPVDKHLPMDFAIAEANGLGLPNPPAGRKWLIYRLTSASQTELSRLQAYFIGLKAQHQSGTLGVGIAQDGIAVRDPQLADTRWESWLRTSPLDGYFELWSGTVADLLRLADKSL